MNAVKKFIRKAKKDFVIRESVEDLNKPSKMINIPEPGSIGFELHVSACDGSRLSKAFREAITARIAKINMVNRIMNLLDDHKKWGAMGVLEREAVEDVHKEINCEINEVFDNILEGRTDLDEAREWLNSIDGWEEMI